MPPSLSTAPLAALADEATPRTGWLLPAGLLLLLLLVGRWLQPPAQQPIRARAQSSLPQPVPIAARVL